MADYQVLTDEQVEQFQSEGYVKIEGCFKKADIQEWLDFAFERLGYDAQDVNTWQEERVHMPHMNQMDVADFSPKAWGAICDLMGGAERIKTPVTWRALLRGMQLCARRGRGPKHVKYGPDLHQRWLNRVTCRLEWLKPACCPKI